MAPLALIVIESGPGGSTGCRPLNRAVLYCGGSALLARRSRIARRRLVRVERRSSLRTNHFETD